MFLFLHTALCDVSSSFPLLFLCCCDLNWCCGVVLRCHYHWQLIRAKTYNQYKFCLYGLPSFSFCLNPRCCQTRTRNYTILLISFSSTVNFHSENIWSQRQKAGNIFVIIKKIWVCRKCVTYKYNIKLYTNFTIA